MARIDYLREQASPRRASGESDPRPANRGTASGFRRRMPHGAAGSVSQDCRVSPFVTRSRRQVMYVCPPPQLNPLELRLSIQQSSCFSQTINFDHSIWEDALNSWQRLARVLGAIVFLCTVCGGLAGQPAYADGSVSSLHMGYGAPDAAAFAQVQSVIQQYNASGERFRIDSHCQSACTMFLSIRNVCVTSGATLLFHAGGSMQKGTISPRLHATNAQHL